MSCKENMERETEILVVADELKSADKTNENAKEITMRRLKRLRKMKEEESAKELLEQVQDREQQLEEN